MVVDLSALAATFTFLALLFDALCGEIGLDAEVEEDVCKADSDVDWANIVPDLFIQNQVCEAIEEVEERDGSDLVIQLDFVA